MKPKVLAWCDFLVPTGFGNVAMNLLDDLHKDYDLQIVGINYRGQKRYDGSKYFVYPTDKYRDNIGSEILINKAAEEQPDIIFLFQDIFHIASVIDDVKNASPASKIISYFPVDGGPLSINWYPAIDKSDALLVYTEWSKKIIRDSYRVSKPMTTLYHGVDTDTFKVLSENKIKEFRKESQWENKFAVCNVNRFQPRKAVTICGRVFSMFAKGFKYCNSCGHHMPKKAARCELCGQEKLKVTSYNKDDVILYLHMMPRDSSMGPGSGNSLQNHMINCGFTNEDMNNILSINGRNIYAGEVPVEEVNKIYNGANINITSTKGEGKLLEGTILLTREGYKDIKNITENDFVINDKGKWSKVNKTLATPFEKPAYKIKLSKFTEPIIASDDHPFLLKNGNYKRADELVKSDILAYRKPNFDLETPEKMDLGNFCNKNFKVGASSIVSIKGGGKKLNRFIPINAEILKFFGLYIAEGSPASSGINFSFHSDETDLHNFIIDIYEKYFNFSGSYKTPSFKKSKKDASGSIILGGRPIAKMMENLFNKGAKNKEFPIWMLSLNEDCRKALLEGLVLGDGCTGYRNTTRYKTSSKKLAYLVRDLWVTLNKVVSVQKEDNSRGYGNGHIYSLTYCPDNKAKDLKGHMTRNYEMADNFIYLNIYKIEKINISELGYDLEVPDGESYTIAQTTVHNCGLSLIESAAVGTPSIAPNNSAIPEMLGNTGWLVDNHHIAVSSGDNGYFRPVVDEWKMVQALEQAYKLWKDSGRGITIEQNCIDRINDKFLWEDKRTILKDCFQKVLVTKQ